ncbi:MAG: hypothetical protein MK171_04490 [Pirellulales bacterium]|nr:hypothetical protein [Pirellulales bacterium]
MVYKEFPALIAVGLWALCLGMCTEASAATITLDLTNGGATSTAGDALDSSGLGSYTEAGITIAAIASGGNVNSLSTKMGVDAPGSDDSDEIESSFTEDLTFTITFGSLNVVLTEIEFTGTGSQDGGDAALLSINGSANLILETGATDFNGSTKEWTPNLTLSSGDTFKFAAQNKYGLEEMIIEVTAIPEPETAILLIMSMTGARSCRRNRRC